MRIRYWCRCGRFVAGLIAIGLLLLALPALQEVRWVGTTDLEVEFVVTDASIGVPVPKASVEINSEGGFY